MTQEIKKPDVTSTPAGWHDPIASMRAELDRVVDSFLGPGHARLPSVLAGERRTLPSVDVSESKDAIVIEAELPGMDPKDIDVTFRDGVLTLKGEKKSERDETPDDVHISERSYGSFTRSFRLPDTVDPDGVTAKCDNGVLKITLPKSPEAAKLERRIPVG